MEAQDDDNKTSERDKAAPLSESDKHSKAAGSSAQNKKRKRGSESEQHKSQLEALKEKDPEFYKYLLETDKELLEFQAGDTDEEEDIEVCHAALVLAVSSKTPQHVPRLV